MTPEQETKLRDELRGLLLESFSVTRDPRDFAGHGKAMVHQMQRGQDLFNRIVAACQPPIAAKPEAKPAVNGAVKPVSGTPAAKGT